MFTLSEENYLKAIYHLDAISEKGISTNSIAKRLETKASSVTDMLKKLTQFQQRLYTSHRLRKRPLFTKRRLHRMG